MKKWFISDTHFSHINVIKYTNRPFSTVEEMDSILIDNWNQSVAENDQVFFLGDFGHGSLEHLNSICSKLKGHKICILGNHDRNAEWMTQVGFNVVLESAFLKVGKHLVELIHVPTEQPPTHFQFHGHVHDKRPNIIISKQLNLCVEVWNYRPVSEAVLIDLLDSASKG